MTTPKTTLAVLGLACLALLAIMACNANAKRSRENNAGGKPRDDETAKPAETHGKRPWARGGAVGAKANAKANGVEIEGFPLRPGDAGKAVERLQVWLLRNHGHFGVLSGVYDGKTLEMTRKHLKADEVSEAMFNRHGMGLPVYENVA